MFTICWMCCLKHLVTVGHDGIMHSNCTKYTIFLEYFEQQSNTLQRTSMEYFPLNCIFTAHVQCASLSSLPALVLTCI